jgi:photosystem II stability/assembly factor-like uncharacterized protein
MQEQEISDRIHAAFEVEPPPGGFDSLRTALESTTLKGRRPVNVPSTRRWASLVAALIAVAIAASAAAYAIQLRQSAVNNPPRPGGALLPVVAVWAYSANDVAIQVLPPGAAGQAVRGYVLITHDGGNSWMRTPLTSFQIGLRWIDSRHIVATSDEVGPPIEVASTSDGGVTWRVNQIPMFQIGTMFFLNDREGWALCTHFGVCETSGDKTILYHTVDAGANWLPISNAVSSDVVVPLGVTFIDSEHGFMSTLDSDSVARLLRTADGGKTWLAVELPKPAGGGTVGTNTPPVDCGSTRCAVDPTFFGSRGVVTVIGAGIAPYTVTTADGGVTWGSPHSMPFSSPAAMPTPWLQAQDPDNWWVVDAGGSLYRTINAGASWSRVPSSLPQGYALESVEGGGNGVLWGETASSAPTGPYPVRSTDGGHTWSLVKLPKS